MEGRIRLFPSGTSKNDILKNKGCIAILDDYILQDKVVKSATSWHTLEIPLDSEKSKDIVNIIKEKQTIKINTLGKDDIYVIEYKTTSLDEIVLQCIHWTVASQRSSYIKDSKPRELGSHEMLDHLKKQSEQYLIGSNYARDLEVGGNIIDKVSTNIWHDNFYNATVSLMELYGAECKREGFKVELVDYVGSKDVKYTVEYGVNLLENSSYEDYNFVLGVHAKGYDKLYADNIVYSGRLKDNPNLMGEIKEIEYNIRVREEGKNSEDDEEGWIYFNNEEDAKAELERLAGEEFTVNHIDQPIIEYTTKFLDLSSTEEFKDNAKAWLEIGDKVATIIPQYNLNVETRVVEMVIVNDEIEDITLSNNDIKNLIPPTLNSIKQEVEKLPSIDEVIGIAKKESLSIVMNGFGGFAHYHPNYTAWTDKKTIKEAKVGLLANMNGWFFFRNGINIETGEANDVTMIADINGNFSASVINTGELNAGLIRVGVITSANGTIKISIDDDYLEVGHGEAGTKTRIDAEGFYILDENNETIASLASKESWTELKADKVFANNIENIYLGDSNLYVNHSNSNIGNGTINNPFNSFSALKEYLEASPIINKDLNIYIISTGNVSDNLDLRGLKGRGALNFTIDKNLVLNGNGANSGIYFYDCQNYISINGGRTGYNTTDGALINKFKYGVFFNKCKYGVVEYIAIDTGGSGSEQWGVLFRNTNGRTHRVDFCDSACAIYADQGSNVRDNDSCGNGSIAFYSLNASNIIFGSPDDNGYRPNGSLRKVTGNIVDLGNRAVQNSFRVAPPIPPTSNQYKDFNFSDYGYYSEGYGNWNSIGYKTIYQGSWGYGNNRGIFTLPNSSINSFLANATVLDGSTITLQRENAGGYSSAQTVYLCGTTHTSAGGSAPPVTKSYGSIGSLAWGERKTFTLPKAFVNDLKSGVIKSVLFYTSDGSNYIKFSAVCTLRLKVNK